MIPVIFGISGAALTAQEIELFKSAQPAGFIIFKRNIQSKPQLASLIESLKTICRDPVTGKDPIITIDQEGGRVQRLCPPVTKKYEAPSYFSSGNFSSDNFSSGDISSSTPSSTSSDSSRINNGLSLCYASNKEMAEELASLGFNMNCTPLADLSVEGASNVIGDRSFGSDPALVARFCQQVINAHLDSGIRPVIKHIPGHGRALTDSHLELPIVDTSLSELRETDFEAFKLLNHAEFAMTAHIVFTAIDASKPATQSKKVIDYIRNELGFKGKIMSDCITMQALKGSYADKAISVIEAGCDYVLHCNGNYNEMLEISGALTTRPDIL